MMKNLGILILVALALSSCVTFKLDEQEVNKVLLLWQRLDPIRLTEITATPFLLDGEIIALKEDAKLYWQRLKSSGLKPGQLYTTEIKPADESWTQFFPNTRQVQLFFKKYVPAKSVIVQITCEAGLFFFILNGEKNGYAQILGIRGPGHE